MNLTDALALLRDVGPDLIEGDDKLAAAEKQALAALVEVACSAVEALDRLSRAAERIALAVQVPARDADPYVVIRQVTG